MTAAFYDTVHIGGLPPGRKEPPCQRAAIYSSAIALLEQMFHATRSIMPKIRLIRFGGKAQGF